MITKVSLLLSGATLLFIFVVWGSYNEHIRVKNVYIEGNRVVLDNEIEQLVREQLSGKYLWVIPKDNIFIQPRSSIKKEILTKFKRVYYVKINIVDFTSVAITVKEREPYALWCGDSFDKEIEPTDDAACYFTDDEGFIFTKAPVFSDNVYFTIYGEINKSGDNKILGGTFLGEDKFMRLIRLRALFVKEGIDTEGLIEAGDGDFKFLLSSGGFLIFNESQNMEKLLHNLVAAIEIKKKERQDIFTGVEYIDMRFENKVLFKFSK